MKKNLKQLKTHDEFVRYARQRGADIEEGGSHTLIVTPKGKCAVPRHPGDLCKGTRFSIIKTLTLLGLACVVIAIWAAALGIG